MKKSFLLWVSIVLLDAARTDAVCKPVSPVKDLNFTEYLRKSWFIQQQQTTHYLPENTNYCVVATYGDEQEKVPDFKGKVIAVHNYANKDEVNGENLNTKNQTLCARQPHNDSTALLVAPCFLPNIFAGDYWVVAIGDDGGKHTGSPEYVWVALSGGQPSVEYPDGCTTKTTGTNEAGLWIFTRASIPNPETIQEARNALTGLGFTLTQLNNVTQYGCKYAGAILK